jgi:hypothetical protein
MKIPESLVRELLTHLVGSRVTLGVDGMGPVTGYLACEGADEKGHFFILEQKIRTFPYTYADMIRASDVYSVEFQP